MNRWRWLRAALGVVLAVSCFFPGSDSAVGLFSPLERFAYDWRVRARASESVDPSIVIVAVDEKSLDVEGRWPWSRRRIGELTATLFDDYKIKLLGLDILFPKETQQPVLDAVRQHAQRNAAVSELSTLVSSLVGQFDDDAYFAGQLSRHSVVLSHAFALTPDPERFRLGVLPSPALAGLTSGTIAADSVNSYTGNSKLFQDSAGRGGHTRPAVDSDGVIRKVPLYVAFEKNYYEAFSVAVARAFLGIDHGKLVLTEPSNGDQIRLVQGVQLGSRFIPTDHIGLAAIPFRGPSGSFVTISATDVLAKRVALDQLAGKLVIVGVTAQALGDLKTTSIGKEFPGVEVHANLISGIVNQSFLQFYSITIDRIVYALLVASILFAIVASMLGPWRISALFLALIAAILGIEAYAWSGLKQVLPLAAPLAALIGVYMLNMSIGFFGETRARRALTNLFGQYVPKDLVKEMSRAPERYRSAIEGENREMTVLFADVRDFTTVSEKLNPKELRDMMNAYLTPITECIHNHHGVIDKYMGDAVMAFWGAPLRDEKHAENAVAAALAMQACMDALGTSFRARGWPELRIGIGINTGLMSVGDMGSQFRRAFTVLGDAVNIASRIEGLTKTYVVGVLVSQATAEAAPGFDYREVDSVVVKGKTEPVTLFAPADRKANS